MHKNPYYQLYHTKVDRIDNNFEKNFNYKLKTKEILREFDPGSG